MDAAVATAVAEAGYVDCTALSSVPSYINGAMPHLPATEPCVLMLDDGRQVRELPATHSLGTAVRSLLHPRRSRPPWVHLYFHDWELIDRRRAVALRAVLAVLGRTYLPFPIRDLDPAAADRWPRLRARDAMRG